MAATRVSHQHLGLVLDLLAASADLLDDLCLGEVASLPCCLGREHGLIQFDIVGACITIRQMVDRAIATILIGCNSRRIPGVLFVVLKLFG